MTKRLLILTALFGLAAPAARAQTSIPFNGTVLSSCTLTLNTSGQLALSSDGKTLGTEQSGGVAAVLALVTTSPTATVSFAAPSLDTKPGSYTGTPTVSLKYTSVAGANQAYTSASSQYSPGLLIDTITLNAKATDASGFPSGTYRASTTVTCQP